jgi:hypothetical protein
VLFSNFKEIFPFFSLDCFSVECETDHRVNLLMSSYIL